MLKLYKDINYEKGIEIKDISVVDILISSEKSSLTQGYYDEEMERQDFRDFGINYGQIQGDRAPFMRGFEFEEHQYEIKIDEKKIIKTPIYGYLFYD